MTCVGSTPTLAFLEFITEMRTTIWLFVVSIEAHLEWLERNYTKAKYQYESFDGFLAALGLIALALCLVIDVREAFGRKAK